MVFGDGVVSGTAGLGLREALAAALATSGYEVGLSPVKLSPFDARVAASGKHLFLGVCHHRRIRLSSVGAELAPVSASPLTRRILSFGAFDRFLVNSELWGRVPIWTRYWNRANHRDRCGG